MQLSEYQLTDLDYADDIAIFAPSACSDDTSGRSQPCGDANQLAEDQTHGYHTQSHQPSAIEDMQQGNLYCLSIPSHILDLGWSLITNDGSSSRDITSRISKAASARCRLSNPLFRKHRISVRTKINRYRALVVSALLYGSEAWATTLADRPPSRRVRHALSKAPPACVLPAAHQQPEHPWTHQATNCIISPTTMPPTLVRTSPPHAILPPCTKSLHDFIPNIHGWKRPSRRPTTRWPDSIKHDLNSAGLDTTNAAQMVFDRPQWKAFFSRLPTLEPEEGS